MWDKWQRRMVARSVRRRSSAITVRASSISKPIDEACCFVVQSTALAHRRARPHWNEQRNLVTVERKRCLAPAPAPAAAQEQAEKLSI